MKLNSFLYKASRSIGKAASVITDVETLLTFDPRKITNRIIRKNVNKAGYKVVRKINKKFR